MNTFYNNENGLYYKQVGDYYLPCLVLSKEEKQSFGRWGTVHKDYLMKHNRLQFNMLLSSGKLVKYLVDINNQAENLFLRLVDDMAKAEGVTEQLKADNQMEWVARMNNIRSRATEIVNADLIYA